MPARLRGLHIRLYWVGRPAAAPARRSDPVQEHVQEHEMDEKQIHHRAGERPAHPTVLVS